MISGYSLMGVGRVPFGLVFFVPAIVRTRILVGVVATVVVGLGCFGLGVAPGGDSAAASGS